MKIYLSLFVLALLALCFFPLESRAAVWENIDGRSWLGLAVANGATTNSNRTWEDEYSRWVHDKIDEEFFTSATSPAYNIATDCAEAQYTFRIIFASQYGLPFSAVGGRLTNKMTGFDSIQDPQARVTAFIKYVIGDAHNSVGHQPKVNTSTLSQDTYPVAINTKYVRPGTIFLYSGQHSLVVHEVSPFGALSLLFASMPKQVWRLKLRTEITQAPEGSTSRPADGLRLWRHPELNLTNAQEPGYSVEQFNYVDPRNNPSGFDFGAMIETKLQWVQENPELAIKRAAVNVASALLERVRLVTDGVANKASKPGCFSQADWQNESTVHKDINIRTQFQKLQQAIDSYGDSETATTELNRIRNERFAMTDIYYSPSRRLVYRLFGNDEPDQGDQRINLLDLQKSFLNHEISSDPNESLEHRWGLETSSPHSRCTQYPD